MNFFNPKKLFVPATISTILIISVITLLIYWNFTIQKELTSSVNTTLEEIMKQQGFNFTATFESQISTISAIAELFPNTQVNDKKILPILNALKEETQFENITYSDTNGNAVVSTGDIVFLGDRDYFKKVLLTKKPVVSEPLQSKLEIRRTVISVSAPIIRNNTIVGVIIGTYSAEKLDSLFLASFDGMGYAYIANNDGKIIARAVNKYAITYGHNLFESWKNARFSLSNLKTIEEKVQNNESGFAEYNVSGEKRLVCYSTIGINDWNIFAVVPYNVISDSSIKISNILYQIFGALLLIFIGLAFWFSQLQKNHVKELTYIAFTDRLTGIANMEKFKLNAQEILDENTEKPFLFIKCDIKNFKLINQTLGYSEGDKILKTFASTLQYTVYNHTGFFARANTDEFIIIYSQESEKEAENLCNKIKLVFASQMDSDFPFKIRFTFGYYDSIPPQDEKRSITDIIERVNFAHRYAKQKEKEICAYDEALNKEILNQTKIENRMDIALEKNEFKVYLQPKYNLLTQKPVGAEALVRWKIDEMDIIYPGTFIPIFERNGFITQLDRYMFEKTCQIIQDWLQKGYEPVTVSVNFSRNHLQSENFVDELCRIADFYNVPHKYLEIELTESAMTDNEKQINAVLTKLHENDFTMSMDDFGSAYSSLGLLKNIPVDVIKIDRSFFTDAMDEERLKTVIISVIDMAKKLHMETVAEGVETKEHIDFLLECKCDIVQGYYFAKPMPHEDFETFIFKRDKQ